MNSIVNLAEKRIRCEIWIQNGFDFHLQSNIDFMLNFGLELIRYQLTKTFILVEFDLKKFGIDFQSENWSISNYDQSRFVVEF